MLFGQKLGARLAKAHRAAASTALHPVHEEDPDADQDQEGQPEREDREEARLLLTLGPDGNLLGDQVGHQLIVQRVALRLDGDIGLTVLGLDLQLFAIHHDGADLTAVDLLDEVRIGQRARVHRALAVAEKLEQREDQDEQDDPECDVSRVTQGDFLQTYAGRSGEGAAFSLK